MRSFTYYITPSHGYLVVPTEDIVKMGIVNEISRSSYIKGKSSYLEQDSDMPKFIRGLATYNIPYNLKTKHITDQQADHFKKNPFQLEIAKGLDVGDELVKIGRSFPFAYVIYKISEVKAKDYTLTDGVNCYLLKKDNLRGLMSMSNATPFIHAVKKFNETMKLINLNASQNWNFDGCYLKLDSRGEPLLGPAIFNSFWRLDCSQQTAKVSSMLGTYEKTWAGAEIVNFVEHMAEFESEAKAKLTLKTVIQACYSRVPLVEEGGRVTLIINDNEFYQELSHVPDSISYMYKSIAKELELRFSSFNLPVEIEFTLNENKCPCLRVSKIY